MSRQVTFEFEGKEFKIDSNLAFQLDSIMYNLKNDWDFVILITGDRKVRVGKSVLAMVVSAYLSWSAAKLKLNPRAYSAEHVFFDNKLMIDAAQGMAKYSIVQYDEAREGLAASKAMKQFQQDLVDFFNECGQLNHVFIIVLPDFFELKEQIAVGRSEFLINVYRKEIKREMDIYKDGVKRPITVLQRGHFEFFDRGSKQLLYEIAHSTRRKSYGHVRARFLGDFSNQYPIDEEQYKAKKKDSLSRFKERHNEQAKLTKDAKMVNNWIHLKRVEGHTSSQISLLHEETFGVELTAKAIQKREGWMRPIEGAA